MLPDTEVLRAQNKIDAMRKAAGLNPAPAPGGTFNFFNAAMGGSGAPVASDGGKAVGTTAVYGPMKSAAAGMGQSSMGLSPNAGLMDTPQGKALAAPLLGLGAVAAAYDTGIRGLNTGIGGSLLVGNEAYSRAMGMPSANPLMRDNQSWSDFLSDVPATYRMVWGEEQEITDPKTGQKQIVQNSITAGQAAALTIGRNWLGFVDMVTPGDLQTEIDKKVLEDTATALQDPANSRGLYSWMSGLYSQFEVDDYQQRESAFNQGAGRWISGASDAAIQWYLAPDVIALKVAGKAGRSLFMQSIDDLADLNKLQEKLALHEAWRAGDPNGKKTAVGKLVESLTKLDERTVAKHKIATSSTDQALVAHAFGKARTFDETKTVMLAFAGHKPSIDKLIEQDIVTGDVLKGALDDIRRQQEILDFSNKGGEQLIMGVPFASAGAAALRAQALSAPEEIARLQKVLDHAAAEQPVLAAALGGINKDLGVLRDVRLGDIPLSKLPFGPNSVARLEGKAEREVLRSAGAHLWNEETFRSGGAVGRTIRVLRSGADLMKTYRIAGHVNLNDSNEVISEIESSMQTLPLFRRLMKEGPDALIPGTDIRAVDFRRNYIDEVTSATTAGERWVALRKYENAVWNALAAHYGLHPEDAKRIIDRYQDLRQGLVDQVRERGWFHDQGDIVVAKDLQSMLAENYQIMDFHLIQQLFRIERGSGVAKVRLGADRSFDWLNSIWRPLVLMRLGYTTRNVTEGWLRELAGWGSFGLSYERALGNTGLSSNDKAFVRWAATWGNRVDRAARFTTSLKYGGLKRMRRNLDAQQAIIHRRAQMVKQSEREHDAVLGRITDIHDTAFSAAGRAITDETKLAMRDAATVNWERADTIARGRITEVMDTADEIFMLPQDVKPLLNVGPNARKRANVASGFSTPEQAQQVGAFDGAVRPDATLFNDVAAGDYNVSEVVKFTVPSKRQELLDLWRNGDIAPENYDRFQELLAEASQAAARYNMRRGNKVVRIVSPGRYDVVHDPMEITAEDIANGSIAMLPKESFDKVKFVRARVAGDTFDFRRPASAKAAGQRELDKAKAVFSSMWDDPNITPDDMNAGMRDLADIFQALSGRDSYRMYEDDLLDSMLGLVTAAEKDPEIAEALGMHMWAQTLPTEISQWLWDKKLLMPHPKLQSLTKQFDRAQKQYRTAYDEAVAFRDELVDRWSRDQWWADQTNFPEWHLPDTFAGHGGRRVPGDELTAPPITDESVQGYVGPGYYTTDGGMTASSYMIDKGMSDIAEKGGEPVFYIIKADPSMKDRFVDLDMPFETPEDEYFAEELADGVFGRLGIEKIEDDNGAYEEIQDILMELDSNAMWGLAPGSTSQSLPNTLQTYLTAIREFAARRGVDPKDFWRAWMDEVKSQGAVGVKHIGGNNWQTYGRDIQHTAYIWYDTAAMDIERADQMSDEGIKLLNLQTRMNRLEEQRNKIGARKQMYTDFAQISPGSMDAARMTPRQLELITQFARESGVGKYIVTDTSAPNGIRIVVNPDMMEVGGDSINAIEPGLIKGDQMSDQMLRQFTGEELGDDAFYPWATDVNALRQQLGDEGTALARGEIKMKDASPEAKARLVRYMEVNGHSHIAFGDEAKRTYMSGAEILGKQKVGAAYGALLDADVVSQRANRILTDDEYFQTLLTQEQELAQEIARGTERLDAEVAKAKQASEKLATRLGKRAQGKQVRPKIGVGEEKIAYRGGTLRTPGPFDPNEQGAMWLERSSADSRVQTELYGYTDFQYRNMRRTSIPTPYTPGDSYYWHTMADRVNKLYRNDPVYSGILQGKTDDEIMDVLFGTERGRSWLRNSDSFAPFKDQVSRETLAEGLREDMQAIIAENRRTIEKLIPDAEVRARAGAGDVTADYLRTNMGWRSDLTTIEGLGIQHQNRGVYKTVTGNVMHVLGAMPESALVRHPFFRARWREEMTRQANLYAEQGVTEFTPEMINAMSRVSRKWALRQTNDTLYTITRMSTPAHALRFVMPFFPAWANAMKYWLRRVPVQQPQNVARYAMAFNAPESAGWVYDDQGNKVQGQDSMVGKIVDKLHNVDNGKIVVQLTPEVAKRLEKVTGGLTEINISKGTLDMMLQGEYFWVPSTGPIVSIPVGWLASQMPDVADAFDSGRITEGISWLPDWPELDSFIEKTELSKALYRSVVPFGTPTKEKDIFSAAVDQFVPAGAQKFINAARGEGAPEFRSSVESIYRDMSTDYELGLTTKKPDYLEAVAQARTYWIFRGLVNYVAPFAPSFRSKYQFYIDRWRELNDQIGTTLPDGTSFTYRMAQDQFIQQYGPTMYRYTKSLSGATSGISPTVGEFTAALNDKDAVAQLAQIGEDASYTTMLTRKFADKGPDAFSDPVYAYQTDRPIEGAPGKYFRGGNQSTGSELASQRELGWYYFRKGEQQWLSAIQAAGLKQYDDNPAVDAAHQAWIQQLAQQYPAWYDDKLDIGGNRWFQANRALDIVLNSKTAQENKNDPYFQSLETFRQYRDAFVYILQQRDAKGGSADVSAKSNADIAAAWTQVMNDLKAQNPDFEDTYNRFFSSDKLLPNPVRTNG